MISPSLANVLVVSLLLTSTAQASGLQSGSAHRRAHKLLKRVAAPADNGGTGGAEEAPPSGGKVVPVTTTYALADLLHQTPLTGYSTVYPSNQATPTTTTSSTDLLGVLTDPLNGLVPTSSSTPAAAPSGSLSASNSVLTASNSSTKASSSTKSVTSTSSSLSSDSSVSAPRETITRVVGGIATATAPADTPAPLGAAALPAGARNVLIGLGATVVGIVALWFIIRKTKFGKSRDRMSPEDWQPAMEENDRDYDPSRMRRQSGASSFHSGEGKHEDMFAVSSQGHGQRSTYPERDFTSGTGASAPIGGYADLARGESPTQSVYEQQYIPSVNHQQQHHAAAYDYTANYRNDGHY